MNHTRALISVYTPRMKSGMNFCIWGKKKENDYLDQLNEGSTGLHVIEQNNKRTKKKKLTEQPGEKPGYSPWL